MIDLNAHQSASQTFDLHGRLPGTGVTLLEASAGTGKTYAIAALTARMVAAGEAIENMLIVTFSRAAAAELQSKVRQRLQKSALSLRSWKLEQREPVDPIDRLMADENGLDQTIERLERAVTDIDLATIATIHEYSSKMLLELGVLADHDPASQFRENLDDVIDQIADDFYAADRFPTRLRTVNAYQLAQKITQQVCHSPSWRVIPDDSPLSDYAAKVRAEFERRKRQLGVHDYSDMVERLKAALSDPHTGEMAQIQLSSRFPIVMVDEFQDTDPAQWEILQRAFADRSTVVLIGDPKQAIYRFRGGDVETYLKAKATTTQWFTLGTNFRSDPGVVAGVQELFGTAGLGTADAPITMHEVVANQSAGRLTRWDEPLPRALRIRQLPATDDGFLSSTQQAVNADVVATINDLLDGSYRVSFEGADRALRPRDIAILVTTNRRGQQLLEALNSAGIAATFSGADSVFDSQAAADWLILLEELTARSGANAKRLATTSFFGMSSAAVAAASDVTLNSLGHQVRALAELLQQSSVMAVFESLIRQNDLYDRLLSRSGGERLLTDLQHMAEILNQAERELKLDPEELHSWLRDKLEHDFSDDSRQRVRRLETDRDAVLISTIHQAKGMEYPVVLLPQFSEKTGGLRMNEQCARGHLDGEPVIDLQPSMARQANYAAELAAEDLRLAYVACTRAKSLLIAWWAPSAKYIQASALHRLLHNDQPAGCAPLLSYSQLTPDERQYHWIEFEAATPSQRARHSTAASSPSASGLEVRSWRRSIDRDWTRTSYTGLTAGNHPLALVSDPGAEDAALDPVQLDEPLAESITAPEPIAVSGELSALHDLPAGTGFGSLVHEILEAADPGALDLQSEFEAVTSALMTASDFEQIDPIQLATGLVQVVQTPLGDLTGGLSLSELGMKNRLPEFDFEVPLGTSSTHAKLRDLARLMSRPELSDPSGVLAGYGDQLAESIVGERALLGFLTGSIDVVLRVPSSAPKFCVLDYKTNRIPITDDLLRPEHYSTSAMELMMREHDYPLQALLYLVALHRYLTHRLPGYRPEVNLGGAGYLFVRGMTGSNTPASEGMPCGVFTWRPPTELILQASDLLAGGSHAWS